MTPRARKRFERDVAAQVTALYRSAFSTFAIAMMYGGEPMLSHHPVTTPAYRAALALLHEAGVLDNPLAQSSRWSSIRYPIRGVLPVHEQALLRAVDGDGRAFHDELGRLTFERQECASAT